MIIKQQKLYKTTKKKIILRKYLTYVMIFMLILFLRFNNYLENNNEI